MFPGFLGHSLAGKALKNEIWQLNVTNIRDFATDNYKTVDDEPFGGGAGMVLKPDIVGSAIDSLKNSAPLIYFTPRGKLLKQADVRAFAQMSELNLLCGHFEGVDERVLKKYNAQEICIGDYVLSGGESAALIFLDAIVRLLPGVMGKMESHLNESFENGLLEAELYTRPQEIFGMKVPEVLLSGDHAKIAKWRAEKGAEDTKIRRPDLWNIYNKGEKK
jgi:tRNA (guanine37-N1)-methyltransferase